MATPTSHQPISFGEAGDHAEALGDDWRMVEEDGWPTQLDSSLDHGESTLDVSWLPFNII